MTLALLLAQILLGYYLCKLMSDNERLLARALKAEQERDDHYEQLFQMVGASWIDKKTGDTKTFSITPKRDGTIYVPTVQRPH